MLTVKTVLGGAGGLLVALWQGLPAVAVLLLGLMVLDFLSGVLAALEERRLSSRVGSDGVIRKVATIILISAVGLFERHLDMPVPVAGTITGMFCVSELLSVAENVARAGVWIPGPLRDALAQLQRTVGERVKQETD